MGEGWISTRGRKVALATAVAFLAWFLLDWLIVTESERVAERVEALRRDFAARRVDACMAFVAEDYRDGTLDKAGLRAQAENFVSSYDPNRVGYSVRSISVAEGRAEVDGVCFITPGPRSQTPAPFRGRLMLKLRRDPDGEWRMVGMERSE